MYISTCILEKAQIINKCSFARFLFFERFFPQMSVIAPLLAFLHFVHFEAQNMSVFSREINKYKYPVNARPSRNKCAFSSSNK